MLLVVRRPTAILTTASTSNARFGERVSLGGSATDRVVFCEHDPSVCAGVAEPDFVREFLRPLLAVDRSRGMYGQTDGP
jgi:hypothetical protein